MICGVSGYIGESKKPFLTYQLITKLFEKSETRGVDAAGYWGVETGEGDVFYHKEPGRSSLFVRKDMWRKLAKNNPNLLLVHARGASKGVGEPNININNHPFTSRDKSIGLVHNGRVDEVEYKSLKQKYEVVSNCDSEILLRIFEAGQGDLGFDYSHRLAGICDIFSLATDTHMAVAVGERCGDERLLWLFRNKYRPLWVVDMREPLGQVFFVSEPGIWEEAVAECAAVRPLAKAQKMVELPTEEIWFFHVNSQDIHPSGVQRFEVCRSNTLKPWQYDGHYCKLKNKQPTFQVVTKLNDRDQVLDKPQRNVPQEEYDFPISEIEHRCEAISFAVRDVLELTRRTVDEQSMTAQQFSQIMHDLEQYLAGIRSVASAIGQ